VLYRLIVLGRQTNLGSRIDLSCFRAWWASGAVHFRGDPYDAISSSITLFEFDWIFIKLKLYRARMDFIFYRARFVFKLDNNLIEVERGTGAGAPSSFYKLYRGCLDPTLVWCGFITVFRFQITSTVITADPREYTNRIRFWFYIKPSSVVYAFVAQLGLIIILSWPYMVSFFGPCPGDPSSWP